MTAIAPRILGLIAVGLALAAASAGPAEAGRRRPQLQYIVDLCAKEGTTALPGPVIVPIWGFVEKQPGVACSDASHVAEIPGPEIRAPLDRQVIFRLHNELAVPISLLLPGRSLAVAGGTAPGTFTGEVPPGGVGDYRLGLPHPPGTYLYESGGGGAQGADVQVAMGLYGALIVEPSELTAGGLRKAYQNDSSGFHEDETLVLSEIDPALNGAVAANPTNPQAFDMLSYDPIYWLINGSAHPDTGPILAGVGERLLLRYLNPSYTHHAMALLGARQEVIAREAFELPNQTLAISETIAAGTTEDTIVTCPATPASIALRNRNLHLTNGSDGAPGGMQTSIECVF